ncbi:MAG: hypothetical protein SFU99_03860 [Saprospiraceae bacterium]|nr:hypothetical protein [Saprospiraceae bacterium]
MMKYALFLIALTMLMLESGFITAQSNDLFQELKFRNVGPSRGGRVTAVAGIPSQQGTFYMGATGGGVWKTTDYGLTWDNVSDGFFATPSIGSIEVSLSNPNIVYVGTGSDGIRSNVITGKGVYKSSDGGKKWSMIGLEKTGQIGAVKIHPTNPDVVFVAAIGNAFAPNAERGVFRTKDGGKNWEKVLYIADTIGITDVEFAPDNPDIIYAAAWRVARKPWTIISGGKEGGIYKSIDGGSTWKKINKDLPQNLIGKIDLAVSAANPNRLWALVEAPAGEGGVYRSDDQGESFTLVSTHAPLLDRPFYYCNIDANPKNADVLWVSSTSLWKSTDGGKNWRSMRVPHGDTHDIWINPNDTLIIVECNDGGANVSTNGGRTWSTQFNQPTAELYQVEVDDQFPYWLYAGQQDNSTTIAVPSLPPFGVQAGENSYLLETGGCETGPAVPKPGNPDIVYANCKGNFSVFNKKTGQEMQYHVGAMNIYGHKPTDLKFRFQRVAPIHVSPHNPDVVYHASQYLHKTTDDGKTWEIISPDLTAYTPETQTISGSPITRDITGEEYYSTIYDVNESKLIEGLIWVGANDGPIHVTQNGGKSWENVTPKSLLPGGRVDCVEPSPHRAEKAYAAILRYQLGDWKPYIFKTEDYGKSWKLITKGIPSDYPVRTVREDPNREGLLYAGTEFGLFISLDDGENWQAFQQNLPITPITDIKINRKDLVLSTMGRGFWIMDDLTALHQWNQAIESGVSLFAPRDAYRMYYRGNQNDVPNFPAPGLTMHYYLSKDAENIQLEILDEKGKIIRAFGNGKPEPSSNAERDMQTNFLQGGNTGLNLSTKAGLHRIVWDMRHLGAWDANANRSGRSGPMVAPGRYEARLKAGNETLTQDFFIRMDPRIAHTDLTIEDLRVQEALALQVRDLSSEAKKFLDALKNEQKKLNEQPKTAKKKKEIDRMNQTNVILKQILAALETEEGRYMTPMLVAQLQYLSSMIDGADQRPGKDAFERYEELKAWYESLKQLWDKERVQP